VQRQMLSLRFDCMSRLVPLLACVVVGSWTTRCAAIELVLQNDSFASASTGTPLLAFLSGEMAASWHTAPLDGDIVGVQVVWGSMFGGSPDSPEFAIHIYDGGTFPNPASATPLASISAPVLTEGTLSGVINEFRFLDPPTNLTPLSVPVTKNQDYIVALEFFNTNSGQPFAPSVKYDGDGCQAGTSAAFTIPGGWAGGCVLGIPGDLGIRAILEPSPIPGDFDGDLDVDGADFLILQQGLGTIYDSTDLDNWETNYGTLAPLSATSTAVPEPASLLLLILATVGFYLQRKV